MHHSTKMTVPEGLLPWRMCGLRIAATGVAACVVEVEGDDGPVFFGSPITNNVFTEYATIDQC